MSYLKSLDLLVIAASAYKEGRFSEAGVSFAAAVADRSFEQSVLAIDSLSARRYRASTPGTNEGDLGSDFGQPGDAFREDPPVTIDSSAEDGDDDELEITSGIDHDIDDESVGQEDNFQVDASFRTNLFLRAARNRKSIEAATATALEAAKKRASAKTPVRRESLIKRSR